LQVGLHGSEPGLPWTTNLPPPVVSWARNAGLESSVMILSGVAKIKVTEIQQQGRIHHFQKGGPMFETP